MRRIFSYQRRRTSNVEFVLYQLLKYLKVPVTKSTVNKRLLNHPNFPSILAISDCLNEWNVENTTYLVDKEVYSPEEMMFPFIAHIIEEQEKVMLVTQIENGYVLCFDEKGKKNIPEKEFLEVWDGVALYAESSLESGEKEYAHNKIIEWISVFRGVSVCSILIFGAYLSTSELTLSSSYYYFSLAIAGLGTVLTMVMLNSVLNINSSFLERLCSLGNKSSCHSILDSDASKLTSWLSWSEIGFAYFAGSLCTLLLFPNIGLNFLPLVNLFALPYTIYSVWYQASVKSWCTLCVAIQILLWISFIVNLLGGSGVYLPPTMEILKCLFCFSIPVITWTFLKPILSQYSQIEHLRKSLNSFKFDSDIFFSKLKNSSKYPLPIGEHDLELGNINSENIVTIVSHPFCSPCAVAHEEVEKLIKYREDLKIQIILLPSKNINDSSQLVTKYLYSTNIEDKKLGIERLSYWYKLRIKDIDSVINRFPVKIDPLAEEILKRHTDWCDKVNIQFTPTLFLNGQKLPEGYSIHDLKYFLS